MGSIMKASSGWVRSFPLVFVQLLPFLVSLSHISPPAGKVQATRQPRPQKSSVSHSVRGQHSVSSLKSPLSSVKAFSLTSCPEMTQQTAEWHKCDSAWRGLDEKPPVSTSRTCRYSQEPNQWDPLQTWGRLTSWKLFEELKTSGRSFLKRDKVCRSTRVDVLPMCLQTVCQATLNTFNTFALCWWLFKLNFKKQKMV